MLRPIPNRENVVFVIGKCLCREFLVGEFLAKADKFAQAARPNKRAPVFHAEIIFTNEFFEFAKCKTKPFNILLADNVRYVRFLFDGLIELPLHLAVHAVSGLKIHENKFRCDQHDHHRSRRPSDMFVETPELR